MKTLSILIAMVFLTGCAALGIAPPPSVCERDTGDSVICRVCEEMGTTPESADLILQIAALRALDDHDKEVVLKFYADVELVLRSTVSYAYLIQYVQQYVDMTAPELLLVSLYLPKFASTQIISAFDRDLLLQHIANMRALLG